MKKLLLILLCLPMIGLGQTYVPDDYGFSFEENSYQYLISDNVNIRSAPSTKASIISRLPIGSRLQIIEKSSQRYTYNNISFPWYKVSFILDNSEKIGYVAGGFIAQEYYIEDYDPVSIIFLSGLSKYYPDGEIACQIRVVKQHEEIDKIEYLPVESPDDARDFNIFRNGAINKGIHIIRISFRQASCAIQKNETTFFFDNNKLYHIKTFSNMDLKTLGYSNGKIQLYEWKWVPSDIDDWNGGDYQKEIIEEYIWDGNKLKGF